MWQQLQERLAESREQAQNRKIATASPTGWQEQHHQGEGKSSSTVSNRREPATRGWRSLKGQQHKECSSSRKAKEQQQQKDSSNRTAASARGVRQGGSGIRK